LQSLLQSYIKHSHQRICASLYVQGVAAERGLILVDTKYEFGKDSVGLCWTS
jgi:phosphoribosylaminoimidazole-succinocarboxamide synthase